MNETKGQVIDYRKLYDKLKDKPAEKYDRVLKIGVKLFEWLEHEKSMEGKE